MEAHSYRERGEAAVTTLKERLVNGETVCGAFVSNTRWPGYVEILAYHGYDCVFVETEHAPMNYDEIETIVRTARLGGIEPIIRVNDHDYQLIARAMDMGCHSIMAPRVETADQARDIVARAKYPPVGRRGAGGYLTLFEPDKEKFLREANEDGLIILQIESQAGIDNLPNICDVAGVDAIFVGPFDLSVDLGIPGQSGDERQIAAIERIIAICRDKNKPVGIHLGNMHEIRTWNEKGVTLLSLGSDIGALFAKTKENLDLVRGVST